MADRFETLATAVAASYMNIPLAHIQGGEITGSIDESVRHAISKLAHLHFPATNRAKNVLLLMGEKENTVHCTGCPAIDLVSETDLSMPKNFFERTSGVGQKLTTEKDYIKIPEIDKDDISCLKLGLEIDDEMELLNFIKYKLNETN